MLFGLVWFGFARLRSRLVQQNCVVFEEGDLVSLAAFVSLLFGQMVSIKDDSLFVLV